MARLSISRRGPDLGLVPKRGRKGITMIGYKGFNQDLKCNGFEFEVGKTYVHDGNIKLCESGFHFCEHPLDVFMYYPPAGSRFCLIDAEDVSEETRGDESKRVCAKIAIVKEVDLAFMTMAAVDLAKKHNRLEQSDSGDRSAATASGYHGAAMASGYHGAATVSGNRCAAVASGDYGAATATGVCSTATATGVCGVATASEDQGAATASGYRGAAMASGYHGAAMVSGNQGAATASGNHGAATASGDFGAATVSGYQGAATAAGLNGVVRGKIGCALFAVERNYEWKIVSVASAIVDGTKIKEMTWYQCKDWQMVEVVE